MRSISFTDPERKYHQEHPRKKARILSVLFFCWTFPTFLKGFRKDLEEEDLFGTLESHQSRFLGDKLEEAWMGELERENPSFFRALSKVFGFQVVLLGVELMVLEFIRMSQPFFLGKLITYYTPHQESLSKNEAYLYASLIAVTSLVNTIFGHYYIYGLQHLGMKVRIACCSLIYRKSLKLSKSALAGTTVGQMVNLLSNDVERFDYALFNIHRLWLSPLQTIVIICFLYYTLGFTSIIGILFILTHIPLQMYLGRKSSVFRLRTALRTDERMRLMNEIINGIQVIKMYTWEKPFAHLVAIARKMEIKQIKATSYIRAILLSFTITITRFAIFLTILSRVLSGRSVDAIYVFVVTGFYNIIKQIMVQYFPLGIAQMAEATVSVKRIRTFLLYDEVPSASQYEKTKSILKKTSDTSMIGVYFIHASARWPVTNSLTNTLNDINLTIESKQLVAIIGEVGSGKSSLLSVILEELPLTDGTVIVQGRLSYASQEPWLFPGTIKDNILFGQAMNTIRYQEVINACSLQYDLIHFDYGDKTIIGERGVTLSGGQRARISLARALYKEADIYLLDDPLSAVDARVGRELFENAIIGFLRGKCTILVTHQLHFLWDADKIVLLERGSIAAMGSYLELQRTEHNFSKMFLDEQPEKEKTIGDGTKPENVKKKENAPIETKESRRTGQISAKIYNAYLKAGGSYTFFFFIITFFVLAQILASGCDYFVSFWVNLEEEKILDSTERITEKEKLFFTTTNCIYVYATMASSLIVLTLARSILFFKYCMRSSVNLHNDMFYKIVHGKMEFFNANPSGRILNRFSKDMGAIDEFLPSVIMDTLQIGLSVLGICTVVSIVNHWILLPTSIILVLFYFLRLVYLSTSRSLKRLEGTTRSPVFTHLNASLQGLTTIRAFGNQEALKREFDNHQDLHSSAYYLFLSCTRAFGLWIDLHCAVYIGLVTMSFLFIDQEHYGGNVGLAVTQVIGLTGMLQWGLRQWSELENQMTSVERVYEYSEIEHEVDVSIVHPPESWPENGTIEFRNVSMKYPKDESHVLKQVNFKLESFDKVGIVGRTGAGKSSLIMALFRIETIEGDIIIDDLITSDVPLQILRSKISIIPQEPVLFSGSIRKNLDPFDNFQDDQIWNALEQVELKDIVAELPLGLHSKMLEGGSNFSVGQRQLFCLARAILRKNKILVLDEATANVDLKTDSFIQRTIESKFEECTVLTIAHRLNTIINSNKILVMENGRVVEFDHPYALMKKGGVFYKLVQETGRSTANLLLEASKSNFEKF